MRHISDDERRARLARRHLLLPGERTDDVPTICDGVVCLHSSDPTSVYLSAGMRMQNPSIEAVHRALHDDRTLVRHHAMRRTIWVMTPSVAAAAHAGYTRKVAASERPRYAKLFGRDDAWYSDAVERVVAVVEAGGGRPVSTRDVGEALPDLADKVPINQGTNYAGTLAPHTRALLQAAFEARIVRGRPAGTWIASQYAWLPAAAGPDVDWAAHDQLSGATEMIRRWLERFGPGTLEDLVWWTGGTKTLTRTALQQLDVDEVELDSGETGYLLADDGDAGVPDAWVALLPGLDPTAMGWKLRSWYLDARVERRVTDRNGNVGPTVWADGRIVGGWAQRRDGTIADDAELADDQRDLYEIEVARLQELIGDTRFSPRFPSPNQASLLA